MLARARESGLTSGVMTFDPHPVEVLAPHVQLRYLTGMAERASLIEATGADVLYVVPFTTLTARTPAREFVRPLVETLGMRALVIGYDFTLGHQRQGNAQFLQQLGEEWGFSVDVLDPVSVDGGIVSSTRIRKLLAAGEVAEAARLLGHRPSLSGTLDTELVLHCDPRRQMLPDARYDGLAGPAGETPRIACAVEFRHGRPTLAPGSAARELAGRNVSVEFTSSARGSYEEIAHTADVALRVEAPTFAELLRTAAAGMGELMADPETIHIDTSSEITARGDDDETLLVNWLNELLYWHEMTGRVFREFDIRLAADRTLEATARGGTPGVHRKQIKAATFHNLHINARDGRWDTTIVFDI